MPVYRKKRRDFPTPPATRNERSSAGGISIRSRNGALSLERDAWSTVKALREATNEYAPHPFLQERDPILATDFCRAFFGPSKSDPRCRPPACFVQVDENGEAAKKCPELGKGDLHIVSVGIVNKNEKVEADELLRQLMTLPRPVRVEFARTTDTASPGAEEKARAGTEKARVGAKQPVKKRQQPGKKRREYITARKKWLRG